MLPQKALLFLSLLLSTGLAAPNTWPEATSEQASELLPRKKWTPATSEKTYALAAQGMAKLKAYVAQHGYPSKTCTLKNAIVRKEWTTLSSKEKKDYINALQCLKTKRKAKTPLSLYPGVRSRHDDFVATHMNQSFVIHGTANFMAWHRYFLWAFEKALREECGYPGYHPYWNWAITALDPLNSPMFDGSDTSMSGTGLPAPANFTGFGIPSDANPDIWVPNQGGGGCITTGPFKDWQFTLGPVFPTLTYVEPNPDPAGLGRYYNPRCLRRDINKWVSSTGSKDSDIAYLITNNTDIAGFWYYLQGDFPNHYMGVHTAGHFTVGGDPGGDFTTSPGDPGFFLHHAMVDYVWWTWQNQDLAKRQNAYYGPLASGLIDPTGALGNGTLDDVISLGVGVPIAPNVTSRDVMNTLDGPFCYIYA